MIRMRKLAALLVPLGFYLQACSGEVESNRYTTEVSGIILAGTNGAMAQSVEPLIYVDTDTGGAYMNHGKHLRSHAQYNLYSVNGCHAIFLYAENGPHSEGVITHFQPLEGILANAEKWKELRRNHTGLGEAKRKYASLFYAEPRTAQDEELVMEELYFLTASLRAIFGKEVRVRYLAYPMTPPRLDDERLSLRIDMGSKTLDSEWHEPMSVSFEKDESFHLHHKHTSAGAQEAIRRRILHLFHEDE